MFTHFCSTGLNPIPRLLGWLSLFLFCFTSNVFAAQITLAWDASSGPVAGYNIYYGTTSGNYSSTKNAGNATTAEVPDLAEGATYYFVVKAYDSSGNESGFSNEVSQLIEITPTPTPTPDGTSPQNGLVAAYNFDEASGTDVLDASGLGNHGTINGATRTTGKFGQALSFNGSSNWVTIPDANSLDLTTAMTLEAWVYPKNIADRQPILAKQGTTASSPNRGYMFSAGDSNGSGKVEVEVFKQDTSDSSLLSSAALNTSGWQHLAFVYQYLADGTSTMTLYINGVVSGSSNTAVGPVQANPQPLELGRYYWSGAYARYFNGLIDNVRIYNRALSAAEILSNMNTPVGASSGTTTVQYTFTTQPSGLTLSYGGISRVTPFTVDAEVGSQQTIDASSQQGYNFSAWSDGGAAKHTITIGSSPKTLTATYTAAVAAPTADFSVDKTSGPVSMTVQFADKSTNATAWSWTFGDSTTSTQQHPLHVYTKAGTYTVTLTASNSVGSDIETKTDFIQVVAAPVASFTVNTTSGTTASIFTFTNTSTGSVDMWSWNFGDNTSSTDKSPVHTYSKPDTYTVSLTATGPGGTHTSTRQISVTEASPLTDFSASPTSGITATKFTFTDSSKGTITAWSWNFGDGTAPITSQNPVKTFSKPGSYNVSLTTTGPGGSDTETKIAYITVAGDSGLVAAYGFEEASGTTATDASGNGNHGAIKGATQTTGRFGKALSFNGSSNWVSIPDADSLDLTTAMTLEAWIYPQNLADRRPILSKQGTTQGSPKRGYMFSAGDYSGSGKIEVEVFEDEKNSSSLLSSTKLSTTDWQHVAFVYQYVGDGTSKMTLYINGVAKGSSTTAIGPVQKNAQPLDLGRYFWNGGYARYFKGLIDEVRIYNRALSAAEIAADMNKAVAF